MIGIIGIGYMILEYIPSIEPPANMRYYMPVAEDLGAELIVTIGTRMPDGARSRSNRKRVVLALPSSAYHSSFCAISERWLYVRHTDRIGERLLFTDQDTLYIVPCILLSEKR